ncbi:MAG TPA: AAA family ATPase [Planctomycetota bacterium]|nr:AAA family ATPase [Planctomycetota bacterium]
MRIHRIRVRNFRGVADGSIALAPSGVTVVEGRNEAGKSSFLEAFRLLFKELDSTHKRDVLDVKPVDRDTGTEIEAEVETGPYRFTYMKRFFRSPATELRVTAPKPEQHTGRLAHDRALRLLEETMDLDLFDALTVQQGGTPEQAELSKAQSFVQALDEAAGRAAAGDREVALFDAVREEYERHFTRERGDPRKPLKEARRAEKEAEERVQDLETELKALGKDVERSAELHREILDAAAEEAKAKADLERREREVFDLEKREGVLKRKELELKGAQMKASTARNELHARQALASKLKAAEERRARAEAAAAKTRPKLLEAEASAQAAETARVAAEAAARDAVALWKLRDEDFKCERARLDLEQLGERRGRVVEARRAAAEARAALEGIRVTDALLTKLHQANLRHQTDSARLDAERPRVEVKALAPLTAEIDGKPRALAAGETADTRVAGETTVKIPNVVEITIRAAKDVSEAYAASRAELDRLLAEARVDTLEAAAAANERRKEAERTLKDAERIERENLRDLTLEIVDEKMERLRAWVSSYPSERPPEPPLPHGFEAANEAKSAADRLHQEAATNLEEARLRALETSATAQRLKEEMADSDVQLRVALEGERSARREMEGARGTEGELADAAHAAEEELAGAKAAHDAERAAIVRADPPRVRGALHNARAAVADAAHRLRAAQDEMRDVTARLDLRNERGLFEQVQDGKTARRHAARELRQLEREAAAAKLLFETMREKREEARRAYAAPLREKVVELGRLVFGESFAVELDDDLRIDSRTLDGKTLPFRSLSVGAREQLSLLARLACALMVDPEQGVPLLFDDTLGHSDPSRLKAMAKVLALAGERCQVVVLTCTPDRISGIPGAHLIRLGAAAEPVVNRVGHLTQP